MSIISPSAADTLHNTFSLSLSAYDPQHKMFNSIEDPQHRSVKPTPAHMHMEFRIQLDHTKLRATLQQLMHTPDSLHDSKASCNHAALHCHAQHRTTLVHVCPSCVQALLQAHTKRLEQQSQAQIQHLASQSAAELQSITQAQTADLQHQLQTVTQTAASKSAGEVAQARQLLEKSEALLAAEKQKTAALKVSLWGL